MTTAADLFRLGYTHLVKIIPPNARISPTSKIEPEMRGKVPGKWSSSGWVGYDWRAAPPVTADDIERWSDAGVGIRTDSFPAVDIDCTDATLTGVIRHRAVELLGLAPERVGRPPKTLLLYRTAEPFGRMRLWIGEHLVEVLGDGQQFVAGGIHPVTGKPYQWPLGLLPADDLTEITRQDAEAFLSALAADADMLGYVCRREGSGASTSDRNAIEQGALRGDAAKVREALALIPNDNDHFPGRDDYLRLGYAIKGALGEEGFPLFAEWAEKWGGNDRFAGNDPDDVESDWQRMKPPFEVGAPYIFELARGFGYNDAGDEFEAIQPEGCEGDFQPTGGDEPPLSGGPVAYSDAAVANMLMKLHGKDMRYCPERGGWMAWDGVRWNDDNSRRVTYLAGVLCQRLSHQALDLIADPKKAEAVATRLASNSTKNAVANYCADHPAMQVAIEKLDGDPYLLNTPAGMVDLRTGEMQPHDPHQYATRCTAVAPSEGAAPLWHRFLDEATAGDVELQRYLQRLIGYALTGLKSEHNLAFLYGPGGNGKGVFLNTIAGIFDSYAEAASMDTFTASKFERHPTDLAGLAGARLVTAQETQEGRRWDEQKVKQLTSADPVKARFMREDFFTFAPTFKLVFAGNHKPEIRNLDDAMRRRFHLVPFTVKPTRVDPLLPDKLKAEWPQILAWAIEGTRMWLAEGLNPPATVLEATAEYFDEEDPIGQWIRDRVVFEPDADFVSSADLYENWREWCGENGEYARSAKALVRALKDRGGFRQRRTNTARGFVGIRLRGGPGAEFVN